MSKELKLLFQKVENIPSNIPKELPHLKFNENCVQHQLLPIFANYFIGTL